MPTKTYDFIKGLTYQVKFKRYTESGRLSKTPGQFVGRYLGTSFLGYQFDCRPDWGTTSILPDEILSVKEVR